MFYKVIPPFIKFKVVLMKVFFLLLATTIASISFVSAAPASKKSTTSTAEAVAVVGKKVITRKDLNDRIDLILVTSHSPVTQESRAAIREQVLKNMIEELVQLQVAQKFKVEAKDKEVMDSITHIAKENGATVAQMESSLKSQGVPLSSLKDRMRAQLSWNNFVRGAYSHTVHVSDKDIETYLNNLKADQEKEQYEVFEIFLRTDGKDSESVKKQASNLVAKIKSGANFRMLAQQFSQSPSASRGGYLGWVNGTHEGNQTYTQLETGQVSSPVQTGSGYYIYYLADKKLPGQSQQSGQLISYKQILVPLTAGFTPETDPYLKAHMEALMEAKDLKDFDRIVKERELKNEVVKDRPIRQIPQEYQGFFNSLPIGKASQPALTPDGLLIIVVTQKRAAEPPKPPSKEEAKDILEGERLSKISIRDLTKHITGAFIQITQPGDFPNVQYGTASPTGNTATAA